MNQKQKKILIVGLAILAVYSTITLIVVMVSTYEPQLSIDNKIKNTKDAVIIRSTFTRMAYSDNGFYKYYYHKCDQSCLTVPFGQETQNHFNVSLNGYSMLSVLGYNIISDVDIDQNPVIVKKYSTLIVLHSEYVTQSEFDAITHHPHVIYLYPNSLYAKVKTDYKNNTITLLLGHGYPTKDIQNGFNWNLDNTNLEPTICNYTNWKFYKIPNGYMLNCYPEKIIKTDHKLLETIQDLAQ
jgi:hypothetical protein